MEQYAGKRKQVISLPFMTSFKGPSSYGGS